MAIYHLDAKAVSRKQRSAVSAAAYRSGEALHDQRQNRVFDFTRKEGVEHVEIIAPTGAPAWMYDRATLWNVAEAVETRKDAMTAREVEVSLPRELSRDQQLDALRAFIDEQLTQRGLVADVAVHESTDSDGQPQPHAHVLFKDRAVDAEREAGFSAKKDRTFSSKNGINELREAWTRHANAALERAQEPARIDHRRLAVQLAEAQQRHANVRAAAEADGRDPAVDPDCLEAEAAVIELDRSPQPTVGVAAAAKARRGEQSERVEDRDHADAQARTVRDLAAEMRAAAARIRERVAELSWQATVERFAQLIGLDQQQPQPEPAPPEPAASEPPPKPRVPPASKVLAETVVGHVIFGEQRPAPEPEPEPAEPEPWPRIELSERTRQEIDAVRSVEPIPELEDEDPEAGPDPGM